MEKQPYQEGRDELADKLRVIRNSDNENSEFARGRAVGYLDAKKEETEYKRNKFIHYKSDIEKTDEQFKLSLQGALDSLKQDNRFFQILGSRSQDISVKSIFENAELKNIIWESGSPYGDDVTTDKNLYYLELKSEYFGDDIARVLIDNKLIPPEFEKLDCIRVPSTYHRANSDFGVTGDCLIRFDSETKEWKFKEGGHKSGWYNPFSEPGELEK